MSNEAYEKYVEELKNQLDKAEREFIEAKKEAIKQLQYMGTYEALEFGAAYFTHIDKVTKAAAELKKIQELLAIVAYFKNTEV